MVKRLMRETTLIWREPVYIAMQFILVGEAQVFCIFASFLPVQPDDSDIPTHNIPTIIERKAHDLNDQ